MRKFALIALAAVFCLPAAAGQVEIERTVPASPDGTVSVELIAGTVSVTTGSSSEVRIRARFNDDYEELEIDHDEDEIEISIEPTRDNWDSYDGDTRLELVIPASSRFEMESISAGLEISGVSGTINVETISGGAEISGAPEEIETETISGRMVVHADRKTPRISMSSISGHILMDGDLHRNGRYEFESMSGTITLKLPSNTSAVVTVETFSGSIKDEFGHRPSKSEFLDSKSLSFTLGSGGARISAESFSGRVEIQKD